MEKEEVVNINFFKKVWYSITKFEKYPEMATEGVWRAIQYLLVLSCIITVFITISSTISMKKNVNQITEYISDKLPEFSYSEGNVQMYSEESITIKDLGVSGIDAVYINTSIEDENEKAVFEEENKLKEGNIIYFYKDQVVIKIILSESNITSNSYTYKELMKMYLGEEIGESFSKADFIEFLKSSKMNTFYLKYAVSTFTLWIFVQLIGMIVDALEIAIFGLFTTMIAGIRMRFRALYNMAAYSLTLPIILNILYIVINYFIDFKIQYFQVAYITIAYIYLAAVIFILKDDFIKKMQEVQEIRQVQKEVGKEINEQDNKEEPSVEPNDEEKGEEDNENDEEKDNKNEEPDGSEA